MLTDIGAVELAVPLDRNGTFEPRIVRKSQSRLEGFSEKITGLYARGSLPAISGRTCGRCMTSSSPRT